MLIIPNLIPFLCFSFLFFFFFLSYNKGFRKGEFRVQADTSSRKLTVKGRRSLGDGKFMHLERDFAVPKDSDASKISGKFEGGCLSLFMPKVSPEPQQAAQTKKPAADDKKEKAEDKKEEKEASAQSAQPQSSATKEEATMQKEKAEDKKETKAAAPEQKRAAADKVSAEPKVAGDQREEAPIQKDQPTSSARTEEEPIQKEKAKGGEETKAAAPVHEEKPLTDEKKEEHLIQDEPIRKKKPMSSTVSDDRFDKYKKKGLAWKETIEEEVGRWLDCESIDRLLETISNNKKVIAAAVAAFSIGFYVSRKLRSSGR